MGKAATQPRVHGVRTGRVWLRDYDKGVLLTLGATLHPDPAINEYVIEMPSLPEGETLVPALGKKNPEPAIVSMRIPRLVVSRDSVDPVKERLHPYTEEYRIPAGAQVSVQKPGAPPGVMVTGHTHYETKEQAAPFDITYTIECWHRYENAAQIMLFHVMSRLPLKGAIKVQDSLGDERTYNAFMESGPTDLSEILSLTDRVVGYAVTYRVQGELDLAGEFRLPSMRYPQVDLTPKSA